MRSRLTKGSREAAHVAWAVPGYRMRCPGLVVSGLDLQHLRKAQSWYKVRWAAQQEFLSGRHSSCSTSCWGQEVFRIPPGLSGRRVPLWLQGRDADAARSMSSPCWHSSVTTGVFLSLEVSGFGDKFANGIMYNGNVRGKPPGMFSLLYPFSKHKALIFVNPALFIQS